MTSAVAVTGVGAICALGASAESAWRELLLARSGIGAITRARSPHLHMRNAAEVRNFDPEQSLDERDVRELDRFAQLALVAAREAWTHAGLAGADVPSTRVAVVTGSAVGGKETEDLAYHRLYALQKPRAPPLSVPRVMGSAAASRIAREFDAQGPCATFSSACAASTHALAYGAMLLRAGRADVVVAGGSEAPLTLGHLLAWDALRVISPDRCRPFAAERDGTTLGEGAAFLVLERSSHARARGAPPLAMLLGAGESADAGDLTAPDPAGAARAVRAALADAGVTADRVGYVNAHGTGTRRNDTVEASALRAALGDALDRAWVSSTKGAHGHLLGAGGALEALLCVLAIRDGVVPPNVGTSQVDGACPLNVALSAQRTEIDVALNCTLAFGGLNAVLAFGRPQA